MVQLSSIRPGRDLLGYITADVWIRQGRGTRYYLHSAGFTTMQEAQAFCWEHDRDLFMVKLEKFIEQAANGMSFQWHHQRTWVGKARPQLDELRSYLKQMQRNIQAPEVMAQYAELVAIALEKSKPYSFIASAVMLWTTIGELALSFRDKYHPDYCKQAQPTAAV